MAESEKTDLELQVSFEESDSDSSFEVIEDPENPRVRYCFSAVRHLHSLISLSFLSLRKYL